MADKTAAQQNIIEYRIDHDDRIIDVSRTWQSFAKENGGDGRLLNILGQSLWDHICDKDTQEVYAMLLDAVRISRSSLSFPYRCDSPCVKRFMRLTIAAAENDAVAFRSEILTIEPLAREIEFDVTSSYKIRHVHVCSNCRKVKVGNRWLEVTDAFQTGELTANKNRFLAVYRMCPACLAALHEQSAQLIAASSGRMDRLKAVMDRYHESQTGAGTLRHALERQRAVTADPPPRPAAGRPDRPG